MPNNITLPSASNGHHDAMKKIVKPEDYYLHSRPEILQLVPIAARKVLDVGCGAGGLSLSLKGRQTVEMHGVELVAEAAELAKMHLDQVWNSTIEDALPDLPDAYYNCIVVADVLEHLLDPWAVLNGLKRKLAVGGKIVASIPNIQNWSVLSDLLQGRWDYRNEGILDRTHLRFFTRKSVSELFWGAGLRIINMSTSVHGPVVPAALLKGLNDSGLSTKELILDGRTYQFLVDAEVPTLSGLPKVIIVIFNWNGKSDTLECLASVKQLDYPNHQVVVVDNGSTDDSVEVISERYPDLTIIQTSANCGCVGGSNYGVRWALEHGADYVLLLSNDTIVSRDLLSAFVSAKYTLPDDSVLGAKIFFYDKPDMLWSVGGNWNGRTNSFERVGYGRLDCAEFSGVAEMDYVTGCALFASAETFKEVGLLDERYFLAYEETDWCYRARQKGHKCIYVHNAKLWRKVSSSIGGAESPLGVYYMQRNKLLWAKKHRGTRQLRKETFAILRRILFPPFGLANAGIPTVRKILWSFSTWKKTLRRNLSDPINVATLYALRDFYLGRSGDSPPPVRALAEC